MMRVKLPCVALIQRLMLFDRVSLEVELYQKKKEHVITLYAPVPMGNNETILMRFKEMHPQVLLRVSDSKKRTTPKKYLI